MVYVNDVFRVNSFYVYDVARSHCENKKLS